jgi:hypothetical protein
LGIVAAFHQVDCRLVNVVVCSLQSLHRLLLIEAELHKLGNILNELLILHGLIMLLVAGHL